MTVTAEDAVEFFAVQFKHKCKHNPMDFTKLFDGYKIEQCSGPKTVAMFYNLNEYDSK